MCAHTDLDKARDSVHMQAYACLRDVSGVVIAEGGHAQVWRVSQPKYLERERY